MHILHIYKDYPPVIGGIEGHLKVLAEAQARLGYRVTVLVTGRCGRTSETVEGGVRVIRAARLAEMASTPLSLELVRQAGELEPDLTHLQSPYPPGEMAYLWRGRGKLVISYQSDIVRQKKTLFFYRPLLQRLLARADRILVSSPNYLESSADLQPHRDRCRVVPLGIDPGPYLEERREEAERVRSRFGAPLLLFVGRLRYYKGVPYLLEAIRDLDVRLLIAGDGPEKKNWEAIATRSGLDGKAFFLGEVSETEKAALYQACDIFVLPSSHRSEAFGLVQLEAMASGKPVISTELSTGTSFVNLHGTTGLVVPPRDSESLRAAIARLIGDSELRCELGKQARRRLLEEFSAGKMTSTIDRIYQELWDVEKPLGHGS